MRVLLAGASGLLGRHVRHELVREGHDVRPLVRGISLEPDAVYADLRDPASLRGICDGVDAVISCAGAAMQLGNWGNRVSFDEVDHHGNANLLAEARRAGVARFVYVSVACARELMHTEYTRAHGRFVAALATSGLACTVVRPTGFYGFLLELLRMAWKNRGIIVGDGRAQTNPIYEGDVARACVEALASRQAELAIGGPEIYTRKKIVQLAFEALDRPPRIRYLQPALLRIPLALTRIVNPRIHALFEFGLAVAQTDVIAPKYGTCRLEQYFQEVIELTARARQRRPVFRPLPTSIR
ncbi:MAG TPA: SDR family oxidoreductase [Bryobacteraceae bacterium]|nr:SDR family oxidoreductase [Bryobacteraceae bacterium]